MSLCLGLDFGTSNSVATLWQDGRVRPVRFATGAVQRTLFFVPDDSSTILLGNTAAEAYFGHRIPGRMVQSVKSHLSSDLDALTLGGFRVTLEALLALFLRFLREGAAAEAGVALEALDHVVLGRPVRFHGDASGDARAERRLATAARMAGFTSIAFQLEPVAAALDHERTVTNEELVLVGDLGGGTSDFAVVRVGPDRGFEDRGRDVLATSGVALAGNALDRDVMRRHVLGHFGAGAKVRRWTPPEDEVPWHPYLLDAVVDLPKVPLLRTRPHEEYLRRIGSRVNPPVAAQRLRDLIFEGLGFSLAEAIEAGKIELSGAETTRIRYAEASIDLDLPLSRRTWEETITETVERIVGSLDEVLARAQVAPGAISKVFLTGGTSQVPMLRRAFDERFGTSRIAIGEVFTSVSAGLARSWPLAFTGTAARTGLVERPPPPTSRIHLQRLPSPNPDAIRRYVGSTLLQPVSRLSGDTLAYLYRLAESTPAGPVRDQLTTWRDRATAELAALDEAALGTLLLELEDVAGELVPHALRRALAQDRPELEALIGTLRDQWEGVEPTPEAIAATPVVERPVATKPTSPRPTREPAARPAGDDALLERAKFLVMDRLRGTKEGLRDGILVESVRRELPDASAELVPRAIAALRREKKLKTANGRWVRA